MSPAGITWAKRVIVLDPGLAWSTITDAAMAASVNVQEVIA